MVRLLAVKSPAVAVIATPTLENVLSSIMADPVDLMPIAELLMTPPSSVIVPLFNTASLSIASVLN